MDPRLPIELGHVVTKCLEKDPARRYSSARSLADDLARFLRGEPVLAQAPSLALRLTKALKRTLNSGRGLERLTTSGGWPVWWPNGEHLGYLAQARDDTQEIRIIDLNDGTTEVLQLKFSGLNHPFDVDPTGKTIVTSNSVHTSSEIWILRPN